MFKNIKISTRLIVLVSIMSLALLAGGGLGLFSMKATHNRLETAYKDGLLPLSYIASINDLMRENLTETLLATLHDPILPESKLHNHPISKQGSTPNHSRNH